MAIRDKVKIIALLAIFIVIGAGIVSGTTAGFDLMMSNFVYSLRTPTLNQIMLWVSFLGSTPFISSAVTIIVLLLWIKSRKKESLILGSTLIASVAINNILKYSFHRLRPDIFPLENASFYSFPSGHAMNSLVFYGLIAYFVCQKIKSGFWRNTIITGTVILIIAISFSRIYLGAHYPTDVIAGFTAGLIILRIATRITLRQAQGEISNLS
jgi:membrane-associated phospholipid phosphatase